MILQRLADTALPVAIRFAARTPHFTPSKRYRAPQDRRPLRRLHAALTAAEEAGRAHEAAGLLASAPAEYRAARALLTFVNACSTVGERAQGHATAPEHDAQAADDRYTELSGRVPSVLAAALRQHVANTGRTVDDVMTDALTAYLERLEAGSVATVSSQAAVSSAEAEHAAADTGQDSVPPADTPGSPACTERAEVPKDLIAMLAEHFDMRSRAAVLRMAVECLAKIEGVLPVESPEAERIVSKLRARSQPTQQQVAELTVSTVRAPSQPTQHQAAPLAVEKKRPVATASKKGHPSAGELHEQIRGALRAGDSARLTRLLSLATPSYRGALALVSFAVEASTPRESFEFVEDFLASPSVEAVTLLAEHELLEIVEDWKLFDRTQTWHVSDRQHPMPPWVRARQLAVFRCRDLIDRGMASATFSTRALAQVRRPAGFAKARLFSSWEKRRAIAMVQKGRTITSVAGHFGVDCAAIGGLLTQPKLDEVG